MAGSKRLKIAFQGEPGAFSHIAARRLAGDDCRAVPFQTFEEIFQAVAQGRCEGAAVPIENTLHGSVHENYDLLLKYDLPIRAEAFVRIVHNLLAPPGVRFGQIKRAFSHPVALNQCKKFFEDHPAIAKTPFYDTAGSCLLYTSPSPRD